MMSNENITTGPLLKAWKEVDVCVISVLNPLRRGPEVAWLIDTSGWLSCSPEHLVPGWMSVLPQSYEPYAKG